MPGSKSASNLFNEFTESTTLHGIRNVFRGKSKFRRFVWFLCLVASTVALVDFSSRLLTSYLNGEVVTRVVVVNKDKVMFPAVTFCNFNFMRKRFIPLLNLSHPDALAWHLLTRTVFSEEDHQKLGAWSADDFLLPASHQIEDMLMRCTFQGHKCRPEDFKRIDTNMGSCYTFDYGNLTAISGNVASAGERYGLHMTLNPELNEYYVTEAVGFKILVHEKEEFPLVEQYGFAIMPKVSTYVAIEKNEVKSLPPPYETKCENRKLIGKSVYTKPVCYEECRRKHVLKKCDCFYGDTTLTDVKDPSCQLDVLFGCVFVEASKYDQLLTKNCACPRPCERITYDTTLSYGLFAWENYNLHFLDVNKNKISKNGTHRDAKGFAEVKIFFKDVNYHVIEDIPKQDFENLVAAVGGMLGLLLGASVLTLLEFFDFLIALLGMKCSKTKTRIINVNEASSDINH